MARKSTNYTVSSILALGLLLTWVAAAQAQIDIGNMIITGEGEVGGLPRHMTGRDAKFEEYRDIPETVIVPDLQMMIGGKKEDFFLKLTPRKSGATIKNIKFALA